MTSALPPRWAETLLHLVLHSRDRADVSGDLLEQYRESIWPARGPIAANRWYIRQVTGFIIRSNALPALLFGGAFVARTGLDWLVPPDDFHLRSLVSTLVAASILLVSGFVASWKGDSTLAGAMAGTTIAALAALVSTVGALGLLAIWHDPATLQAIERSGGLGEVFSLPVMVIVPGLVLGTIGGLAGTIAHWTARRVA